jgi:hypothetical protein
LKKEKIPAHQSLAELVREKSKAGQLVAAEQLLLGLKQRDPETANENEDAVSPEALLINVMAEHEDLKEIRAKDGTCFYYCSMFMSEPYARILLHKQEGAADLIADTVREDSDRYPRPTPLDVFKDPPVDMSHEELFSCLEQMPGQEEYQDIHQLSTSTGRVFLYSSRYLERDYALMLAEWVDVGQFENP